MRIRIKFGKYGIMKFIGHLDMMRYFQKTMRRADIDIAYSEGFSPHQIMSFAAPLGVGITSDGEYLDIEVHTTKSSEESVRALNEAMVEGVKVFEYKMLPEGTPNAMSSVAAADYTVYFKDEAKNPFTLQVLSEALEGFYQKQVEIVITKQTKKSEKTMDLKPLIYELKAVEKKSEDLAEKSEEDTGNHGETYMEQDKKAQPGFFMSVCTGSTDNIKPELVLQAFSDYCRVHPEYNLKFDFIFEPMEMQIHRKEVYARTNTGEFSPLGELGQDIP